VFPFLCPEFKQSYVMSHLNCCTPYPTSKRPFPLQANPYVAYFFSVLKNVKAELISQEEYTPPCSQGNVCSQEEKRNILEIFHHLHAQQEVNAMPREQARIHKHEVWFARAQEFHGRQTIRSDDDLVASLLCQYLTKL
jgi:hypothetical protein